MTTLAERVEKALKTDNRLDANIEYVSKLQFAVHDKIAMIGQMSALHAVAQERCQDLKKLKPLHEKLVGLVEIVSEMRRLGQIITGNELSRLGKEYYRLFQAFETTLNALEAEVDKLNAD